MKVRLPSLGFVYLAGMVACFVAFFAYVLQPMWWETGAWQSRKLAEAEYLERISADGPEARKSRWLSDAINLYVGAGEMAAAERVLRDALAEGVAIKPGVAVPGHAAGARIVGADARCRLRGGRPAMICLQNELANELVVRLFWQSGKKTIAGVRPFGEKWQEFVFDEAGEAVVERVVPANGVVVLEARRLEAGAADAESALQLVRAEVQT